MTLKQGADLGDTVGNTSSVIGEFLQANCHWSRMKRVILSYSTCAMIKVMTTERYCDDDNK